MSENLNSVVANIVIDGKKVSFLSLKLEQEFNSHHKLELLLNYRSFENKWMEMRVQLFNLVGERIVVTFLHKESGVEESFVGVINKVSYVGHSGVSNQLLIEGSSPTLSMDSDLIMDSFIDKQLQEIVEDVVEVSGNGIENKIKPIFKSQIDYFCQYRETYFQFLNRLSYLFGEWFYYDGHRLNFGKPEQLETVDLIYDSNIKKIDISAKLMPAKIAIFDYIGRESKEAFYYAQDNDLGPVGYAKNILKKSSEVFKQTALSFPLAPVSSQNDLAHLVKVRENMALANMFFVKGESVVCNVGVGKIIRVKLLKSMGINVTDIDSFVVKKVVHEVDGTGTYHNTFEAFVVDAECVPVSPAKRDFAVAELGLVVDNSDDKGRVKVKLYWQDKNKTTNWIRVMTPDGGVSDEGTRGFAFIPEIGDQVIVSYEYGDPSRPFVMGSTYPEKIGKGGGEGNKGKKMVSRSGVCVELDDATGSIKIKDKNGIDSTLMMDGEGNISFQSKESISLQCGKSFFSMNKDGEIGINGKSLFVGGSDSVDMVAGAGVDGNGGDVSGIHVAAAEVSAASKGNVSFAAENDMVVYGKNQTQILADKELVTKGEEKISIN